MAGAYRNIVDSAEQFKQAKWKTIKDYEKEQADKKAKETKPADEKKPTGMKKGGKVKGYAKGGGCELRGKTKGRMV